MYCCKCFSITDMRCSLCVCVSAHIHLHAQCCHSLNSSDREWMVWYLSSCTALLTYEVFLGLATLWACPGLGKSIVHSQPIQIKRQTTTTVFDVCAAPKQHTCAYEFQHVNILSLWETDSPPSDPVWMNSPPGIPSTYCTVMLSILATHPVNCTVLHKCLPQCLPSPT
jgi:hypothetical protein